MRIDSLTEELKRFNDNQEGTPLTMGNVSIVKLTGKDEK